jgi:hypothetical protein
MLNYARHYFDSWDDSHFYFTILSSLWVLKSKEKEMRSINEIRC